MVFLMLIKPTCFTSMLCYLFFKFFYLNAVYNFKCMVATVIEIMVI
uniref:Uncharacterized protein n=1 Tax=Anguilla anguilla TaxID=7936 RepID=A0A0E9SBM0_ANGAN